LYYQLYSFKIDSYVLNTINFNKNVGKHLYILNKYEFELFDQS